MYVALMGLWRRLNATTFDQRKGDELEKIGHGACGTRTNLHGKHLLDEGMGVSVSMVIPSSGSDTSFLRWENALAIHPSNLVTTEGCWIGCFASRSHAKLLYGQTDTIATERWMVRPQQEKLSNFVYSSFTTRIFPLNHFPILNS